MYNEYIRKILSELKEGRISLDEAVERFSDFGFEDIGFAKIDHQGG